jgi:hypothetical protein
MGVFNSPTQRMPYVPPLGPSGDGSTGGGVSTLLGGDPPASNDWISALARQRQANARPDPNFIPAADPGPASTDDDAQIAQQRPTAPRPPAPQPTPRPPARSPGGGYGTVSQNQIERGMSPVQKQVNRSQALLEFAGRPLAPGVVTARLPDDWEQTKPWDVVDDLKRAAQRHNVPLLPFARMMYQEGKFNEPENLDPRHPLVWESTNPDRPIGWAQMTARTLDDLTKRARARGDTARATELEGYSLANREQAFDAAAEYFAYIYRSTRSWPAAAAGYNIGPDYMQRWLTNDPALPDPINLKTVIKGKDGNPIKDKYGNVQVHDRWKDMTNYVANAFRNFPTSPQVSGRYAPDNRWTDFKVAAPIPRTSNVPDP